MPAANRARTSRKARARACAATLIEDHTGKIAFVLAPDGVSRRYQICLRTQDGAVFHDFQAVGGKRRAARRDVDDHLGGAGRGRPFGRA